MGKIEDCNPPKDVVRWAIEHGKSAHGITLNPDAAQLLAELVGNDLGRLDTELAKLALQTDDGKVDADDDRRRASRSSASRRCGT